MTKLDCIDVLSEISYRLERFKASQPGKLYNFRCPFCGDSKRNKNKARGYLYESKNTLAYKCHNCGLSLSFPKFLKLLDEELYKDFFFKKALLKTPHTEVQIEVEPEQHQSNKETQRLTLECIHQFSSNLSSLSPPNIAFTFAIKRKIPDSVRSYLFYTESFKSFILNILPEYEKKVPSDPRIIIPFLNEKLEVTWIQGRALFKSDLKYVTVPVVPDAPKIYGLHKPIMKFDKIFVLEGPIDSLFLPNSVAVAGSDLNHALSYLPNEKLVFIFDNEPDNREIIKKMRKIISLGHKIVIWPKDTLKYGKDVNDLIQSGLSIQEVLQVIENNIFTGLAAETQFLFWKS